MYKEYFGLKETPFTISPDPRYLFMSERHRDALAHLLYGIGEGGGFVLLTGEVGTGKTTVCRCLLEQLPDNVRLAYILNPKLNSVELMATMCDELGIEYEKGEHSLKAFTDLLSDYLLTANEKDLNTVLMIDEAQNLSVDVLEQIRLLTNLETHKKKLLQIILIGQPELQELLAKKELRQLAQRITARYHLRPLSFDETKAYLEHRLRIAGCTRPVFSKGAIEQIHKSSEGVPRLINVISDRSLLGSYAENKHQVSADVVVKAVGEVLGNPSSDSVASKNSAFNWKPLTTVAAAIALLTIGWFASSQFKSSSVQAKDSTLQTYQVNKQQSQELKEAKQSESKTVDNLLQPVIAVADKPESDLVISQEVSPEKMAQQFWQEQSWDRQGLVASQNLLALWGVEYLPYQSGEPCQFAKSYTLACDRGMADWSFLTRLNRPVNLKFNSGVTGEFWGTLTKFDGNLAVLQFGDNKVEISKQRLNPIWTGEYQLFWKKPEGMGAAISLASQNTASSWLMSAIQQISGTNLSLDTHSSAEITRWVQNFQQEKGLAADGMVGKHTVISMNNLLVPNIPQLNANQQKVQ